MATPTLEAFDEMRAISVLDGQKTDHSGDVGKTAEDVKLEASSLQRGTQRGDEG